MTAAPLALVPVKVDEPFSLTTVFVSPGSLSVSLVRTPAAGTLSVLSSSVDPVSSFAVGASFWQVTVMDTVACDPPLSVYVNSSLGVPPLQ